MSAVVTSLDGQTVDEIVWQHFGSTAMVEAVLEANRGLAARGARLPYGVRIVIPDEAPAPVVQPVRLWS